MLSLFTMPHYCVKCRIIFLFLFVLLDLVLLNVFFNPWCWFKSQGQSLKIPRFHSVLKKLDTKLHVLTVTATGLTLNHRLNFEGERSLCLYHQTLMILLKCVCVITANFKEALIFLIQKILWKNWDVRGNILMLFVLNKSLNVKIKAYSLVLIVLADRSF